MNQHIRKFCLVYGMDEELHHRWLFHGGDRFNDLAYISNFILGRTLHCEDCRLSDSLYAEDLPASFASHIYRTRPGDSGKEETLYAISKTMTQVVHNHPVDCGQFVVFSLDDFAEDDTALLPYLFGAKYLTAGDLKSIGDNATIETVFPEPKAEEYEKEKVLLDDLTHEQKKILARICSALMQQQKVVVRLSTKRDENGKLNYEKKSLKVLQFILEGLPLGVRCKITFATACGKEGIKLLKNDFSLFLTDDSVELPQNIADDGRVWVTLDDSASLELGDKENLYLERLNVTPEERQQRDARQKAAYGVARTRVEEQIKYESEAKK